MGDFDLEKAIEVAIEEAGGRVFERGRRIRVSTIGFTWEGKVYRLYLTRSNMNLLDEIKNLVNKVE